MTGKLKDLTINRDNTQNITITINADFREEFDKLKDSEIEAEIKKVSSRRSLDANAFLWHLCSEVAKRSSKYSADGKNEIYREAIRAKGMYLDLAVMAKDIDGFMRSWGEHGIGWFADVVDTFIDENWNERNLVHAYYGTSIYTSAQLSPVIDYVVIQAEDLGIPTITPKELEKLLGKWTVKQEKRGIV